VNDTSDDLGKEIKKSRYETITLKRTISKGIFHVVVELVC